MEEERIKDGEKKEDVAQAEECLQSQRVSPREETTYLLSIYLKGG